VELLPRIIIVSNNRPSMDERQHTHRKEAHSQKNKCWYLLPLAGVALPRRT
jgi:hypothetical protein